MLLSDKATSASWRDRWCVYCIILFLKQAISPQHLHWMDILAWRRQNSPECLPLIMRGIKNPTPVSATLLLTHHDVLWAGRTSLSPSRSGVDCFSVIQHTEELALGILDASSICIKANAWAPSGVSKYCDYGSNQKDRLQPSTTRLTGSLKPMSFLHL